MRQVNLSLRHAHRQRGERARACSRRSAGLEDVLRAEPSVIRVED